MNVIGYAEVFTGLPRKVGLLLVSLAALSVCVFLLQEPAHAGESFTWTGEGKDGAWNNPCNWYPKDECQTNYPGKSAPDDSATLAPTGSAPAHVTLGENVTLATLSVESGSSLTGGSVTVTRSLNWTGGTLATKVNISGGSVGNIDGLQTKQLGSDADNPGILNNQGSVSIGPDATLLMSSKTQLNNFGRLAPQHGARIKGMTCCVNPPTINNVGNFSVTPGLIPLPGADTVTVSNASFKTDGRVNVSEGVLELRSAPGEISNLNWFTGDGTVRITDNAKMTMLGSFTVSPSTTIELGSCGGQCGGGSLLGTGSMTGDGRFLWSGGTVAGDLTLGPQIDTRISGPAIKSIAGGKIMNLGYVVMPASAAGGPPAGVLNLGSNDKFVNQGTFVADERTSIVGRVCCTEPAVFENTGFFSVAPDGTTTPGVFTAKGISFRAGGEVHVERGALEFRQGLGVLQDGLQVTGKGALRVTDNDAMMMNGTLKFAPGSRLELDSCSGTCGSGELVGDATLTGGGRFDWLGGTVGESASLDIDEGSSIRLTGPAAKELQGNVINRGKATYVSKAAPAPATGPLTFVGDAKFFNSGLLTVGDRSVFKGTICCVNPAMLVNQGQVVVSKIYTPSTGLITIDNVVFENRGTTKLEAGKLRIGPGGYSQLSGQTQLVGGNLESRIPVEVYGGKLNGAGTITGDVHLHDNAIVSPGAPGSASSTGIIKIVGNYTQTDGILNVDLKGSTPGTGFDQLQVTGRASIGSVAPAGSTLDLDTITGYAPAKGTRLKVLTAAQRVGEYDMIMDVIMPSGRIWNELYPSTGVTLEVR